MALSVVYLISIVSLVFIVHLGDAERPIADLCKYTRSFDLCTQILNADPSSKYTNTAGRAEITINAAKSIVVDTSRYILDELVKTFTEANAIRVVTECSTLYDNAKAQLEAAIEVLYAYGAEEEPQDGIDRAASCLDSCKNSFSNATPPLAYPDALAQRQKSFQDICGVADDIVEQFELGD
ncbi:uncharacterized protein LOC113280709 [Papaver somniferum]|uniref:uncharacterized protein LOC113280709 n=1 Tax=Papaver somniferum TaxID=3469 RepID=UPI000E6F9538|nr:uncharacterized protein LOC113280709 [Papaver somniferum]